MKLPPEKICIRAKKGFDELDANSQLFEDCYDYMLPYKNNFSNQDVDSFKKPTKQYDSTAMHGASNFVNTMQANFTPVFTRWAELTAGPGIPEENRAEKNKQLSELTDKIYTFLDASNFSSASAEMYFDWGIGSGSLWLHEGDVNKPLNFVASPINEMGLVEGRHGTIDSRFRKHDVKARLIEHTWPNSKVTLNEDLQSMARDAPDKKVELLEACYYDYDEFVWRYSVIHEGSKHEILEEVYTEEICFTPRWMKIPGKAFGIGPFILAMADVKTLNKMKEYMLRSSALSVFGVYTVASSKGFNPNSAKIAPNAFIPVERNGGPSGPTIAPLPRAGDFQLQEFLIRDLQDNIRKTLLDTKLPEQQATPATAFEIAERIKEFQQDIGSAYGRAMFEFVQPLFRRVIAILARKGLIQLPEGFEIDNFFTQIKVVSPIAQTQAIQDVQKFMQTYEMTASISPELAQVGFKIEEVPKWLTEKTGSPAELLRDEAEVEQIKQQTAQAMQQQAQQQQQPQQGV